MGSDPGPGASLSSHIPRRVPVGFKAGLVFRQTAKSKCLFLFLFPFFLVLSSILAPLSCCSCLNVSWKCLHPFNVSVSGAGSCGAELCSTSCRTASRWLGKMLHYSITKSWILIRLVNPGDGSKVLTTGWNAISYLSPEIYLLSVWAFLFFPI